MPHEGVVLVRSQYTAVPSIHNDIYIWPGRQANNSSYDEDLEYVVTKLSVCCQLCIAFAELILDFRGKIYFENIGRNTKF